MLNGVVVLVIDLLVFELESGLYVWNLSGILVGVYILVVSYIDGVGDIFEGILEFIVIDQLDNLVLIIVYFFQNINVVLDFCVFFIVEVSFQVFVIDNCEGVLILNVSVLGSVIIVLFVGNIYVVIVLVNVGLFIVSIFVEDGLGNSCFESFVISVIQVVVFLINLVCNDNINVIFNDNCFWVIIVDMVFEGNFGCLIEEDFSIIIVNDFNFFNGNIVDGDGQFIYDIFGLDVFGFENCWGYVIVEDKIVLVISCLDDIGEVIFSIVVQKIQGVLMIMDV